MYGLLFIYFFIYSFVFALVALSPLTIPTLFWNTSLCSLRFCVWPVLLYSFTRCQVPTFYLLTLLEGTGTFSLVLVFPATLDLGLAHSRHLLSICWTTLTLNILCHVWMRLPDGPQRNQSWVTEIGLSFHQSIILVLWSGVLFFPWQRFKHTGCFLSINDNGRVSNKYSK